MYNYRAETHTHTGGRTTGGHTNQPTVRIHASREKYYRTTKCPRQHETEVSKEGRGYVGGRKTERKPREERKGESRNVLSPRPRTEFLVIPTQSTPSLASSSALLRSDQPTQTSPEEAHTHANGGCAQSRFKFLLTTNTRSPSALVVSSCTPATPSSPCTVLWLPGARTT